ncbi:MAG: 16S rRNA (uracil(1498)-N(3))-methyltransferase [Bacteroidaceae bacterium]|nr:16S rRNA (uracil(1498)-N(3))-methyltransferase [Bacteroidaceae bacterium]
MALFYAPDIETTWELPEEEATHCLRVLRLGVGSTIEITDGKGTFHEAIISSINGKHCHVESTLRRTMPKGWQGNIHIAIAPTKNIDRIEWMVEKAVEIGLDELTFLNCRFSERKVIKNDRIERIAISAMKQSLKPHRTIINEITDFKKFISIPRNGAKYIAHCYDSERKALKEILIKSEDATILIGPEGDFSPEEVEAATAAGFIPISLGNSRLRTETAGLAACHIFNLKNEI